MARIAFFGTPEFSLPSLMAAYRFAKDYGHEMAVVVSQKDQPSGRGQSLMPPVVKSTALSLGIPVWQPSTLKINTREGDEFFARFKSFDIDLGVVVAYGKIITKRLLKSTKRGFVNVHASLLPRFRGAAPIQRAIEHGDRKTGVCLMEVTKGLDEGDVYRSVETPILPFDNAQSLFRRLSHLGAHLLYHNLTPLLSGTLKKTPQSKEGASYAAMVHKYEGIIDSSESVSVISRRIRAFDPSPGCYGFIRGKRVKFFGSFFIVDRDFKPELPFGTVVVAEEFLGVKGKDGVVYFLAMQVEGKAALPIRQALRGFPLSVGEIIAKAP